MSSDGAARADALVAKAEKRLKGWSLMGNKYEDAQEMLEKAANLYVTTHALSFSVRVCIERLYLKRERERDCYVFVEVR